jgi:hypothetical protein
MAITALPDPPSRQEPSTFSAKSDAFLGALPTFATEANPLAADVNTKANTATTKATEAAASANSASEQVPLAAAQVTLATNQATLAQNWATSLTVVSAGLYGARYYAQIAQSAVATLPDGTINDVITTSTDTWSSSKISKIS